MNRTLSTIMALFLLLVVPLLVFAYLHNSLVGKEENVSEAWAQTESNYQRRADLIPALVETISRYLRHERETLTEVTEARAQDEERLEELIDILIKAQETSSRRLREESGAEVTEDPALLQGLFQAQAAVGRRMGDIVAVAEAYPELRSSDQFLELQAQLEGTENRINVARLRFNDAVRDYNATLRQLPWNLVAGLGSFRRKAYFRSAEEAQDAPVLGFD